MMAVDACRLINAVGNLQPKKLARMCEAIWKGDLKRPQKLHYELWQANANQAPKCATSRFSSRQLTPFSQGN